MFRTPMMTLALGALVAGSAAGCATTSNDRPPPTAAASADDAESSGLMEYDRYHHGGIALFISMSLDTLGVSPEQRTVIEKIRADLRGELRPAREAERELLATLADGLGDGGFDGAKVSAAIGHVNQAAAAVHDTVALTLNELHDILTPAQRAALVDKVDSHWAVWREENAEEGPTAADVRRGHLAALTDELALTPEQVDKIRAALAAGTTDAPRLDGREIGSHLRAFSEAFRAASFDARTFSGGNPVNVRLIGWGAGHLAHVVEAMSPVLTPTQRATLAQTLRAHADHPAGAEVGS